MSLFTERKEKINVYTIAEEKKPVSSQGLSINPHYNFENAPALDILLVPGCDIAGTLKREALIRWVEKRAPDVKYLLTVCTGAFVLAKIGLLDGLTVTTHFESVEKLKDMTPRAIVDKSKRFHDNGKIITSAGISAGIDMSLHVVQKLMGNETAVKIAKYMEYDWKR